MEVKEKGIDVSNYAREAQRLNALLKQTKCKRIIVLGDFKHDVYGFKHKELWVLRKFLALLHCKDITVVKGNHDSELEQFEGVKVVDAHGMLLKAEGKTYGLFHGHALPSKEVVENAGVFLFGNTHPLVEISEGDRFSYTAPIWLVGKTRKNAKIGLPGGCKWVLFPAFGSLAGGVAINKVRNLGPFLKKENADLPNAELFLLSGVKVGTLKNLQ